MPKLSDEVLERRFPCQFCARLFRTRQGLSGHIQFVHNGGQQFGHNGGKKSAHLGAEYILTTLRGYRKRAREKGVAESQPVIRILRQWLSFRESCDLLGIKLTEQDFRDYLVTSMAVEYENEELRTQLGPELEQLVPVLKMLVEHLKPAN